ncbi:MAG TPA: hypothetical protein ENI49_01655 [Thermoplasmatales archaeon]|nr:hypothetical protein [Thermoplasmatales archaeon]
MKLNKKQKALAVIGVVIAIIVAFFVYDTVAYEKATKMSRSYANSDGQLKVTGSVSGEGLDATVLIEYEYTGSYIPNLGDWENSIGIFKPFFQVPTGYGEQFTFDAYVDTGDGNNILEDLLATTVSAWSWSPTCESFGSRGNWMGDFYAGEGYQHITTTWRTGFNVLLNCRSKTMWTGGKHMSEIITLPTGSFSVIQYLTDENIVPNPTSNNPLYSGMDYQTCLDYYKGNVYKTYLINSTMTAKFSVRLTYTDATANCYIGEERIATINLPNALNLNQLSIGSHVLQTRFPSIDMKTEPFYLVKTSSGYYFQSMGPVSSHFFRMFQ